MVEESQKALWGWRLQNLLIDHVQQSEGPGSRAIIPSSGGSGWDGEGACLEDRMFLTCSGSLEPHLPFGLSCYCLVPNPLNCFGWYPIFLIPACQAPETLEPTHAPIPGGCSFLQRTAHLPRPPYAAPSPGSLPCSWLHGPSLSEIHHIFVTFLMLFPLPNALPSLNPDELLLSL